MVFQEGTMIKLATTLTTTLAGFLPDSGNIQKEAFQAFNFSFEPKNACRVVVKTVGLRDIEQGVDVGGFEPPTSWLQTKHSSN
jgi:hypothetical protein